MLVIRISALMLLLLPAAWAGAAQVRDASLAERYVRLRAADAAGDLHTASSEMSALLQRDGSSLLLAQRAYRQALTAGDRALALKSARLLEAQGALPPDGPLLYVADAVARRDWTGARAATNGLEAGRLFAFMAPLLRGWIALGAGNRDALAVMDRASSVALARNYLPVQRALLLLASGKVAEGAADIGRQDVSGARLRLIAASALERAGRRSEAAAMLVGDDAAIAAARARLAAGQPVGVAVADAGDGVAELLIQVALDFDRQQLAPVAITMARLATIVAPRNAAGWIETANLLARAHRTDAALGALDHVAADDALASAARTLRVAVLVNKGRTEAALAEARAATTRPGAGVAEWSRVGDVLISLDRPAEAAEAYGKATALPGEGGAGERWQLWLQRGNALELAGRWSEAYAALIRARSLAPDQAIVLNHLGYMQLSRREHVPEAVKLIERADQLRPGDPSITDSLGWARYVQGDVGAAVPLLERAASGDPGEPTINEHLGDAYWSSGRRREARFAWRAALVTAEAKEATRLRVKLDTGWTPQTAAP